jgi:hypothetical protein
MRMVCCADDCKYNDGSECNFKGTIILDDTGYCLMKKVE